MQWIGKLENTYRDIAPISKKEQDNILAKKLDERINLAIITDDTNPDHDQNRLIAYSACQESFKFACDNFFWINDPEALTPEDKHIPYLLYDFQEQAAEEIIKAIEEGYDFPIDKSRAMGLTWLMISIIVWGWHFRKWDILVGSRKFEEVDKKGDMGTLFEKARYIINRMPQWMFPQPLTHFTDKIGMIIHPQHQATIAGEGNSPDFGRSDRRKAVFLDEFTSWEQTDRSAWQAVSATARCRIPVSTPNRRGVNCWFVNIMRDAKEKNKPYLSLHWTLHPTFAEGLYYDEEGKPHSPWYDNQIRRAPDKESVAQELDINYDASMGNKVFPGFDYDLQVSDDIEYDENLPLYLGWDFGLDTTSILWFQEDRKKGVINIIDEYENNGAGMGTNILHYIEIIQSKEYKQGIHYGDPQSGENRSLTSGQSNANILRRYGYIFKCQKTSIKNRIAAGRNLLPKIRISSKCILTIEMFTSWQMTRPKTGNTISEIPAHNEFSHRGDAYTYFCFNHKQFKPQGTAKNKKNYARSLSGTVL